MTEKAEKKSEGKTEDKIGEYRKHLVLAEQKAQEDFDKTVFALSGGALGISFAFIKDIVGDNPIVAPKLMIYAWVSWSLSLLSVLLSYYFSHLALRKTIKQVDAGKIFSETPGGFYSGATAVLNALGGILFVVGLIFIICFIKQNFGG